MSKPEIKPSSDPTKTCFVLGDVTFEVDSRYIVAKGVGYGAYGVLCVALDASTEDKLVIEKVEGVFSDLDEARVLAKEMTLLHQLSHPNIVSVKDILKPTSQADFQDFYIVYEPMAQDLREKIRSARLSIRHARYFCYQLLCALKYIHSAGIVHGDIRPKHLLVDDTANLKVFNFTSASVNGKSNSAEILTRLDQPYWYCAPELLSGSLISPASDIWSAGCILGELLSKRPLFKGKTPEDVLGNITTPRLSTTHPVVDNGGSAPSYTEMVKHNAGYTDSDCPEDALELLGKLLQTDPSARISASAALEHPWFSGLREDEVEVVAASPASLPKEEELTAEAEIRVTLYELSLQYSRTA